MWHRRPPSDHHQHVIHSHNTDKNESTADLLCYHFPYGISTGPHSPAQIGRKHIFTPWNTSSLMSSTDVDRLESVSLHCLEVLVVSKSLNLPEGKGLRDGTNGDWTYCIGWAAAAAAVWCWRWWGYRSRGKNVSHRSGEFAYLRLC